jgi:hypothetical protein
MLPLPANNGTSRKEFFRLAYGIGRIIFILEFYPVIPDRRLAFRFKGKQAKRKQKEPEA